MYKGSLDYHHKSIYNISWRPPMLTESFSSVALPLTTKGRARLVFRAAELLAMQPLEHSRLDAASSHHQRSIGLRALTYFQSSMMR